MDHGRADTSTDGGLAVASETFSQESGQFTISERYMLERLFTSKSGYAIAQGSNRFINILRFLKSETL